MLDFKRVLGRVLTSRTCSISRNVTADSLHLKGGLCLHFHQLGLSLNSWLTSLRELLEYHLKISNLGIPV